MFIEIENIKLNYKVQGTGVPVVLLHGWGHSVKTFERLQNFLSEFCCVYSLDLPGFGESSEPATPWDTYDYCRIVEKFVASFHLENCALIGHSLGGSISIIYATRNPVSKLILLNSAGVRRPNSPKKLCKAFIAKLIKGITSLPGISAYQEKILNGFRFRFGSEDYRSASRKMQQILSRVLKDDLRYLMPKVKAPTLLIWGDRDTATPIKDAKIMERLIPDAGLVVYPGVGHFTFLDRAGEVEKTIKYFLTH